MPRDLRDPKLLGERILAMCVSVGFKARQVADLNPQTPNYNANPGTIEKYGRPQDLPETPF